MLRKIINKLLGKPKDSMSFMESMNLVNLPIVTFFQGDKRFNFLLDTGSNSSVIDKNALKNIKHTITNNPNLSNIMGMDGILHQTQSCEITLYYKDREYTYEYIVQDMKEAFTSIKQSSGVTLHGIIGSSFFNKFKYVLDFDDLIAYSKM